MNGSRRVSTVLAGILLVSAMVLAACGPTGSQVVEGGPRAWVGGPPDGSEVPIGEVSVMCHAFARGGVSQVELYVNGAFANRAANPDPGNEYFTANLTFETTGPGSYVVHCRTYGQDGGMVQSDPVTVRVTGEEPTPTTGEEEIPTATPTSTEVPPTEVPPTPTVPPPTGTAVPPTATRIPPTTTRIPPTSTPTTPPRPTIQSLEANPPQISKGSCFRASWAVVGVISAVYFDGEGVGDHDFRDKCPGTTTTYTLRAVGPGGEATENVTVVVIQASPTPSDSTGPSIVWKNQWTNGGATSPVWCGQYCSPPCGYIDINAIVTDPSGVSS
ncbi:MAG: hypothetical protein MUP64_00715, partial [Anaerolineae bacterium]|nr:hypothetical protein [Anaerolineae bacterium]